MSDYITLTVFRDQGSRSCPECDRVWDLNNPDDSSDYFFGHDCEA